MEKSKQQKSTKRAFTKRTKKKAYVWVETWLPIETHNRLVGLAYANWTYPGELIRSHLEAKFGA